MSATKSTGSGHMLWPLDSNVEEIPDDLMTAIDQATKLLSWQENLVEDEMPPRWMWHLDWKLETWFAGVQKRRDEKYGNKSKIPDQDDDLWDTNEYADRFK